MVKSCDLRINWVIQCEPTKGEPTALPTGSLHPCLFPHFEISEPPTKNLLHISLQKWIKDTPVYVPRRPHQPWHSAWWDPCSSYGWTKSPVKRQVRQPVVGSIEVDKSLPIHLSRRVVDYCQSACDYYIPPAR